MRARQPYCLRQVIHLHCQFWSVSSKHFLLYKSGSGSKNAFTLQEQLSSRCLVAEFVHKHNLQELWKEVSEALQGVHGFTGDYSSIKHECID